MITQFLEIVHKCASFTCLALHHSHTCLVIEASAIIKPHPYFCLISAQILHI